MQLFWIFQHLLWPLTYGKEHLKKMDPTAVHRTYEYITIKGLLWKSLCCLQLWLLRWSILQTDFPAVQLWVNNSTLIQLKKRRYSWNISPHLNMGRLITLTIPLIQIKSKYLTVHTSTIYNFIFELNPLPLPPLPFSCYSDLNWQGLLIVSSN